MSREEGLPPNYRRLDKALRSIGYSFEVAVADVIDNSIDARAKNVLIRLITKRDGNLDLAIWDDGFGMNESTLKEAMRFGANASQDIERLGKFGLGLKLASLSQARDVRVVTVKAGKLSGRAWLEHGIATGFTCTVFETSECKQLLAAVCPDRKFNPSATVVCWSRLYRVGQQSANSQELAQRLMHRLKNYLSLAFHRFLAGRPRKLNITLDIFDQELRKPGIPINLDPLDPFGYERSGQKGFPVELFLDGPYDKRMSIKAHIWPPNSDAPEYKLPGGANSRQGFYFYRNNRLIQGGGWNGIREVEPHYSLARVEVNMASDFDIEISLDVKKVEIQLPTALDNSIRKARTSTGIDFKRYLSIAEKTYRTRKLAESELPLIPSKGLPSQLKHFLHRELRIKATAKHRDLKFKWKDLETESFFEIDQDRDCLYLNRAYRRQLLHGLSGSATDIPVVKCLLFLSLEDAISSERFGPKIREKIELVNRILVEAVKYERYS